MSTSTLSWPFFLSFPPQLLIKQRPVHMGWICRFSVFFFLASLAERKDERVGISGKAAGQALESGAGRWREREGGREREREKFIDNQ